MTYQEYFFSIKNKNLQELSLKELAFVHLNHSNFSQIKGQKLYSALPLIIQEIRHAKQQRYSQNFLPIAAAFTVLDQLGFCYARRDMTKYTNANASSIKKSLYYFCGFEEDGRDTKTLYALRNSFLHTCSLISKAQRANQPSYSFVFDRKSKELITYPEKEWDGVFENLRATMTTTINPELFVELVESAIENVRESLLHNNLTIDIEGDQQEFFYRFLRAS